MSSYNEVKFNLGHYFADSYNGSLCAELTPLNMSLESNATARGQFPVPPLHQDEAPDWTGDLKVMEKPWLYVALSSKLDLRAWMREISLHYVEHDHHSQQNVYDITA